MILCSLKTELLVLVRELVVFLFIRLADLLFTLWFWRTPKAKLPEVTDPLLLEPATLVASRIRAGKVTSALFLGSIKQGSLEDGGWAVAGHAERRALKATEAPLCFLGSVRFRSGGARKERLSDGF
ncbi:hypothetical protein IscW_ISCW002719 [Ixodes scapularis]|uniref:Uncharacterized protein n=1 Tax=Ixodes scapularis TaxID=6945 RepID=B7PAY6_IXOSC|nr:hypothetical protein IscW_ISCW002719 [Ixodes scapularis]|eukprot:XP_002407444.1 hypothetical protein IscW_ISCW002719 [Ixodes scapularis]